MHGAVEPSSWLARFSKLSMQFHERFLDQVLRDAALADQAQGVTQQRRFEGSKQLFNRFGRLRARFVWLAHSHALLNDRLASPARAARLFVTGSRWSEGIDTRVRSFLDGFGGNVLTGKLGEQRP